MRLSSLQLLVLGLCAAALPVKAEIIRSGWIPNRIIPQGQVQLVDHDGVRAIHVMLDTRFLDRVVNAIVEKESGNWPEDHDDAKAYVDTLRLARADVGKLTGGEGRETLMISFTLDPQRPRIEWFTGAMSRDEREHLVLPEPRALRRWEPSPEYLHRNAELILADSFDISLDEARALLRDGPR